MTTTRFVTLHIVVALGLHNLNRDGNGLPKSQIDGGVQRGRLSSQSIKRGARTQFRDMGHDDALRTRNAAYEISRRAKNLAHERGVDLDETAAITTALKAVMSMYASDKKVTSTVLRTNTAAIQRLLNGTGVDEQPIKDALAAAAGLSETSNTDENKPAANDTFTFFSQSELDGFAQAIVDAQTGPEDTTRPLVADAASDALDIAAFGRMFANQTDVGTHAAVAVSHAVTVHQMQLVSDYFSTVDDLTHRTGHLSEAYYTSGTYYRTFTLDVDQLHRSWSAVNGEHAREALTDLIRALIYALPRGKVNTTNASALPRLVLAEVQNFRHAYSFEEPVQAGPEGGYVQSTVKSLAAQRTQALTFDPALFGDAMVLGETHDADYQATPAQNLPQLIDFVVDHIYRDR